MNTIAMNDSRTDISPPALLVDAEQKLTGVQAALRAATAELAEIDGSLSVSVMVDDAGRRVRLSARRDELASLAKQLTDEEEGLKAVVSEMRSDHFHGASEQLKTAHLHAARRYAMALRDVSDAQAELTRAENALREIGIIPRKPMPLLYVKELTASVQNVIRASEAAQP
ncbi:MAG: hypothetical protein ACTHM2_06495 [Afipia sp.]